MTPERIRFKLNEARFFLDGLNRDLPSTARQHPEVIEYYVSAFLNAMHRAHDSLRKYRPDPLAHLSKADSEEIWRMRGRRNEEAHQLTRLEETEDRGDGPVPRLRFTDGPQEEVLTITSNPAAPPRPVPLEKGQALHVASTVSLPALPWPLSVAQRSLPAAGRARPIHDAICGPSKIPSCEATGSRRGPRRAISARLSAAWEATADEPGPCTSSAEFLPRNEATDLPSTAPREPPGRAARR